MQILSKQLSGLGNQLFQYAAGLYFAERYRGSLLMLQEPVEGTLSHGQYSRPFLLPKFQITAPVRMKNRIDQLMLGHGARSLRLSAPLKTLLGIVVRQESVQQRYRFVEDMSLPSGTRTLYLSGYWQAHQYAGAIAARLRREFQFRQSAQGRNLEYLQQIASAPASISLHIRRGDYTLAAEGNIALPLTYYRRAIDLMRKHLHDPVFFVFSDDLEFARRNLSTGARQVFVEGNDDLSSHEDLRLMAACQHHIIANSSFSWWGAWLNPREDKIVVAPRHWHLSPESFYPDLLPPSWHALDSLRDG